MITYRLVIRWLVLGAMGLGFTAGMGGSAAIAQEVPWSLVAWKPIQDNPVFTGTGAATWDRKIRERGYILPTDDGSLNLWYTGYDGDRQSTMSLGHATSRDGIHWSRDPHNPIFTESWVEDMCVVKHLGGYQMFAEGKNDIAHRLSSADGLRWVDHGSLQIRKTDGTPIGPGPYGTPTAWFENGTWSLFYERGDRGIWLARSTRPEDLDQRQGRSGHPHGSAVLRLGRRGPQPDRQAGRLLLRVLSRHRSTPLEGLDHQRGPIA